MVKYDEVYEWKASRLGTREHLLERVQHASLTEDDPRKLALLNEVIRWLSDSTNNPTTAIRHKTGATCADCGGFFFPSNRRRVSCSRCKPIRKTARRVS